MAQQRRKIVAGNWKLHGSIEMASQLVDQIQAHMPSECEVVVCPPAIYLPFVRQKVLDKGSQIKVGAQNVSEYSEGAYTGELAAEMIAEFGQYVILGHSERRSVFGEKNQVIAHKFKLAQKAGLTPILCVGESLEQRESDETMKVVLAQIDAVIEQNGVSALENSIIAYEPVWAIGTGKTATPEQAQQVHQQIRAHIAQLDERIAQLLPVLYGGSVKADNAQALFSQQDIDGGLIGGASLKAEQFLAICNAAG